jgi:hypothetical protein
MEFDSRLIEIYSGASVKFGEVKLGFELVLQDGVVDDLTLSNISL